MSVEQKYTPYLTIQEHGSHFLKHKKKKKHCIELLTELQTELVHSQGKRDVGAEGQERHR